jgi:ubiquinone/menaquinone biosynthesis C-methylase UbiE
MAIGEKIETRGHVIGFKEEIEKAANTSDDDFFAWFDSAKNKEASFIRGSWDFLIHIALPCSKFLSSPEEKVALEIGHGGGRLLAAASRHFREVIGVDIHENNEKVANELKSRGVNNCTLIKTDGKKISVSNDSIDLVYSFIVLQHVEHIDVFKHYLNEVYRILKPNGIAVLYFGRKYLLSINKGSKILYQIDSIAERFLLPNGFQEIPAKVNCTNLIVSLSHAKMLAKKLGFEILMTLVSHKKVPDGVKLFGGQNGLVLKKCK